jgi:hypothetical protein
MINEIEVPKKSVTVHVFRGRPDLPAAILESILSESDNSFRAPSGDNPGQAGFIQPVVDSGFLRSCFSFVEPYEVSDFKDGVVSKHLGHRIKSCELLIDFEGDRLFAWGDPPAITGAIRHLASHQCIFQRLDLQVEDMMRIEQRMYLVKSIGIQNPKTCAVRRVKLSGKIENYIEYKDTVNLGSHTITSVQGIVETDNLQYQLAVTPKGIFKIGLRPGFILTTETIHKMEELAYPGADPE